MTTASALAIARRATGLIIAVVAAFWHSLDRRIDEQRRRLDKVIYQMGVILRSLGRLEGRRSAEAEAVGTA